MITRLVILANSWKNDQRCVAGVDFETGVWVRPVSSLEHGEVPHSWTVIGGRDLSLLDVVDIPLSASGPDFGFERENRSIEEGAWTVVGKKNPVDMVRCGENGIPILHNNNKYVAKSYIASLRPDLRRTLQLVHVNQLTVHGKPQASGRMKWEGAVVMRNGLSKSLVITDPIFCARLETGYRPAGKCLLTISLSLPYVPCENWVEPNDPCWKLIAGVIELPAAN